MKARHVFAGFATATLIAVSASGGAASAAQGDFGKPGKGAGANGVYIVRMVGEPLAAYAGSIPGYKSTKPAPGEKLNRGTAEASKYGDYLAAKHDSALAAVSAAPKLYSYRYVFNGFAAKLSAKEAEALKSVPGVLSVTPDEMQYADTASTPGFLGLTDKHGLWDQLGKEKKAGKGIIVGIIDSGIWIENQSFAGDKRGHALDAAGKPKPEEIPGWNGACVAGEDWLATTCNTKVIGARFYNAAWGGSVALEAARPWEFQSPRDYQGHGSHTASTAAGNHDVEATGAAAAFGKISGMAPAAMIAVYKALWSLQDASTASGYTSDLVAAIDEAVADGVDVINYSISGTSTNFLDPVEIAFFNAAEAGVFVAASAGNSGPGASTVAHPSPWITTVGASTHNRSMNGAVTLGNAAVYVGPSTAAANTGMKPLIDSVNAGLAGANATQVELCYPGTLDPAKVTGKIVLCRRGVNARVDKSFAVQMAGGVGMVLYNPAVASLNADLHFVPTVHVDQVAGPAIKAYIATAGAAATAQIAQGALDLNSPAPTMATFSSRGQSLASSDLLKPDLTAPGVDILAAVAPPGNKGRLHDLYSGTSMSSPHVAGLAALLKQKYPKWSPMAIKSALMTSAYNTIDGATPQAMGAGHVQPNAAADTILVYDSGPEDWIGFLCGTGRLVDPICASLGQDPSDLNLASITIGELAGAQTIRRTVTNVDNKKETYTASITGLVGIDVTVSPSVITLKKGESATFQVTFTRTTAALNVYSYGWLTWTEGKPGKGPEPARTVRSPLSIRPVAIAAPTVRNVSGASGSTNLPVQPGYTGPFAAVGRGLVAPATQTGNVVNDAACAFAPGGPGTTAFSVIVPPNTRYARFATFNAFTDGNDDLDLFVYLGGTQVGVSGGGTTDEEVNLVNPAAGTYTVYVHGCQTDGPDANFTVFNWQVGDATDPSTTVTGPASVSSGVGFNVNVAWTGLMPATKYLGLVSYHNVAAPATFNDSRIGMTVVNVSVP